MTDRFSLESRLAEALPQGLKIRVYHVSTTPTASPSILAAPPGQDEENTVCESHFLSIASAATESDSSTFVYAIEALIFTTASLTTIFVSKADSSGFFSKLNAPKGSPSIVKTITEVFLDYLLASRLGRSRLILSLFARSQNQYLFPGSVENAEKHVLDDRQLIKWWCKVLDAVWRPYDRPASSLAKRHNVTAHVVVPGCDKGETKAFFPVSSKADSHETPKWLNTYPIHFITGDDSLPLRSSIPRLPDDPKSRFLDDLDGDYIGSDGQWRNVKSLSQFWEMMSYRQECHAGRLVGFIWITFEDACSNTADGAPHFPVDSPSRIDCSVSATFPTPVQSFSEPTQQLNHAIIAEGERESVDLPNSPPPSSPIRQEHTRVVSAEPAGIRTDQHDDDTQPDPSKPLTAKGQDGSEGAPRAQEPRYPTKGEIVLPSEDYEALIDFLLELDFAGVEPAMQATKEWIKKVIEMSAVAAFGKCVVGKKHLSETASRPEQFAPSQVNMLTGIRKKRKPESEPPVSELGMNQPQTNVLSSNLVRKKPKAREAA